MGTSSLILLVQKYTPEIEPRKKKTNTAGGALHMFVKGVRPNCH